MVYPRYYPFSAGLMLSRGTYNTMPVPQPLHNIPYVTLVVIESDLEWPTPTNDVRLVVTEPLGMVASRSQNQWIHSPHITHTFDRRANMYSKPMAITTAHIGVSCHTMQIILSVFYMHVFFFYKPYLVNRFSTMFFPK
jgi:hypothetical protein